MLIFLDTCIICTDYKLASGPFKILFDYAEKTSAEFVLSRMVYDEVLAKYREHLTHDLAKYRTYSESISRLLPKPLPKDKIDVDAEVERFSKHLLKKLRIRADKIYDYSEAAMRKAVQMAITRRRPCSDQGEEIRDAILWNSIMEYALKESYESSEEFVFISSDRKQFCDLSNGNLHLHLVEDCKELGVKIDFFSTLSAFGEAHASKIEFITADWINSHVSPDDVIEKDRYDVEEFARTLAEKKLREDFGTHAALTGEFEFTTNLVELENFYVYEMFNGELQLEAYFYGEIEVACEVRIQKPVQRLRFNALSSDWEPHFEVPDPTFERIYVRPAMDFTVSMTIIDGKMVGWLAL